MQVQVKVRSIHLTAADNKRFKFGTYTEQERANLESVLVALMPPELFGNLPKLESRNPIPFSCPFLEDIRNASLRKPHPKYSAPQIIAHLCGRSIFEQLTAQAARRQEPTETPSGEHRPRTSTARVFLKERRPANRENSRRCKIESTSAVSRVNTLCLCDEEMTRAYRRRRPRERAREAIFRSGLPCNFTSSGTGFCIAGSS